MFAGKDALSTEIFSVCEEFALVRDRLKNVRTSGLCCKFDRICIVHMYSQFNLLWIYLLPAIEVVSSPQVSKQWTYLIFSVRKSVGCNPANCTEQLQLLYT